MSKQALGKVSLFFPRRGGEAKLGLIFSLIFYFASFFTSFFWTFIPLSIAYFSKFNRLLGVGMALGLVAGVLVFFPESLMDFDRMGLGALVVGGLVLSELKDRARGFFRFLLIFSGAIFLATLGILALNRFGLGSEEFSRWFQLESGGHLLPVAFSEAYWPEEFSEVYQQVLPLYQISFLGWHNITLVLSLLLSALLFRLYHPRAHSRRFWMEFALWRAPDYVLIPLVAALGLLAISSQDLIPKEFSWASWLTWNLLLLSLLPFFFSGISLLAWLMPRLSYLFLFILFFLLVVYTLPMLTLTGLADIWFDLRRRLRSNSVTDELDNEK